MEPMTSGDFNPYTDEPTESFPWYWFMPVVGGLAILVGAGLGNYLFQGVWSILFFVTIPGLLVARVLERLFDRKKIL